MYGTLGQTQLCDFKQQCGTVCTDIHNQRQSNTNVFNVRTAQATYVQTYKHLLTQSGGSPLQTNSPE